MNGRSHCNAMSAGIQLSLQVTRCQLKNQRLYKALTPPHQRKSARFLSVTEQRKLTWRISKRHIYWLLKPSTQETRWILMLYSAFHRLDVIILNVNYLLFELLLLLLCVGCAKCDVYSLKEAGVVSHKWCGWPLNFGIIMYVYNRHKRPVYTFHVELNIRWRVIMCLARGAVQAGLCPTRTRWFDQPPGGGPNRSV